MAAHRWDSLTFEQAQHALYLDFEGQKDKPPVLLGCVRRPGRGTEPWVWQMVLAPRFAPLARADGLSRLDLSAAIEWVVRLAEQNDRRLVAWSEHELLVVRASCPADLVARFEARFVNARQIGVRWAKIHRPDRVLAEHRLADYLALIDYAVPPAAGPGRVGETIEILEHALERDPTGAGLTANQRVRWSELRSHNRHDCAGMRAVCLRATADLETAVLG